MAGSPSFPSRVRENTSWGGMLCTVNMGHEQWIHIMDTVNTGRERWVHVVDTLHRTSPPANARKARTVDNLHENGSHCPCPFISAGENLHFNNNVKMPSYSRWFKAFSFRPGVLGNLLKNWLWLFPNSKGNDAVVLFILGNGCG